MTNSYKKTPITGITTAKSEKFDKILLHRKIRAIVRKLIRRLLRGEEIEYVEPLKDEVMDKWSMQKDGKVYYHKNDPWYKKIIRK